MQFENTSWILVGLAITLGLAWVFHRTHSARVDALKKFASGHLLDKLTESVSPGRRKLKRALFLLAVFSLFVALARPQVGFRWEEVKRKGIDIMLALDTSKSMLARDVVPDRLERSKLGITDFIGKLGGDRVGLIPFAGEAFLTTPLTLDYGAFFESLNAIDTTTIPRGGTNLAAAIREADRAFVDQAKQKILVLITDGEDLEGEALTAAKEAAASGITIHTVGVGTPAGELVPLQESGRSGQFVKDGEGQMVMSRLDEKMLREIASVTGGSYHPLGRAGEGLDTLYRERLDLIPKQELSERMRRVPIDRFEWPLLFAFGLLMLEFVMGERKSRRALRAPVVSTADRRVPRPSRTIEAFTLTALLLLSSSLIPQVEASPQKAQESYEAADYAAAEKTYEEAVQEEPGNEKLLFNLGAAAYKNANYDKSHEALQSALKSDDLPLQNDIYYNLGNVLYRKGQQTEQAKPQETIEQWERALESYEAAMKLQKNDADARFNYEYVKKKLEQLEKQQQQKKENQQSRQKQEKQQDQKNEKQQNQNENQQSKNDQQNQSGKDQDQQDNNTDQEQKNQSGGKNQEKEKQSAKSQGGREGEPQGPKQDAKGNSDPKRRDARKSNDRKDTEQRASGGNGAGRHESQKEKPEKAGQRPSGPKENPQGEVKQASGQADSKKRGQSSARVQGRRLRPGSMTKEEAEQLLDSLKGDDQQVSFVPDKKGRGLARKEKEYRDW